MAPRQAQQSSAQGPAKVLKTCAAAARATEARASDSDSDSEPETDPESGLQFRSGAWARATMAAWSDGHETVTTHRQCPARPGTRRVGPGPAVFRLVSAWPGVPRRIS